MAIEYCEFSEAHYRDILDLGKARGYRFVTFADVHGGGSWSAPTVLLRHDVDFAVGPARRMAKVEWRHGVRSTFFVRAAATGYNIVGRDGVKFVRELLALGHEVGLHAEPVAGRFDRQVLQAQLRCVEIAAGQPVTGVSLHMPKRNGYSNIQWAEVGSLYEAGAAVFNVGRRFVSDSNRVCKPVCLCASLKSGESIYGSMHPIWWFGRQSVERVLMRLRAGG